jgi:hypothetical protein
VFGDIGLLFCWCLASPKQVEKSNPIEKVVVKYDELPFCLFRGCHILLLFSLFSPMCLGYPKLVGTVFGNIQVKS